MLEAVSIPSPPPRELNRGQFNLPKHGAKRCMEIQIIKLDM